MLYAYSRLHYSWLNYWRFPVVQSSKSVTWICVYITPTYETRSESLMQWKQKIVKIRSLKIAYTSIGLIQTMQGVPKRCIHIQYSIFLAVRQLYGDEDMWYQHDGHPPCCHSDVRAYLDSTSRPMDTTQRICWSAPTPVRFIPTHWFFLVGLLYGRGVQPKANNRSGASERIWTVLYSRPSSKFSGRLSSQFLTAVYCATKVNSGHFEYLY